MISEGIQGKRDRERTTTALIDELEVGGGGWSSYLARNLTNLGMLF